MVWDQYNIDVIPAMDTDKIKVFGARIKVDSTGKLAELERAEKVSWWQLVLRLALIQRGV